MTKKLDEYFNLPSLEEELKIDTDEEVLSVEEMATALDKPIDLSTDVETQLDEHVDEMDEVYEKAMKAHQELLDLGFNVDSRNSGQIFEPATKMLAIALDASKSKNEQRLKRMKLQLEKQKLANKKAENIDAVVDDQNNTILIDRNSLFEMLKNKQD